MNRENRINSVIETTMKNLNSLIDVNTVIGKPTKINDKTLIPISKVTFGFMNGSGEYGEIKLFQKDKNKPFAGGNGGIVSLKPVGFLVEENGDFKLINVSTTPYDKLLEKVTEYMDKVTIQWEKK